MTLKEVRKTLVSKHSVQETYHVSHYLFEGAYLAVGAFVEGHGYVTVIYGVLLVLHFVSPLFDGEEP